MVDGLEKFLKYVLERSKETNGGIHHESGSTKMAPFPSCYCSFLIHFVFSAVKSMLR